MKSRWVAPALATSWTALTTAAFVAAAMLTPRNVGHWSLALGSLITGSVLLLAAVVAASRWHVRIRLHKVPSWPRALVGIVWLGSASVTIDALFGLLGLVDQSSTLRLVGALRAMPLPTFIASALAVALFPALSEEALFRGAIGPYVERESSLLVSFITTSLLFGAIHLSPIQSSQAAILGVLLHVLARTEGLSVSILAHAANNLAFATLARVHANPSPNYAIAIAGATFVSATVAFFGMRAKGAT